MFFAKFNPQPKTKKIQVEKKEQIWKKSHSSGNFYNIFSYFTVSNSKTTKSFYDE